jgi:hypothetical protein
MKRRQPGSVFDALVRMMTQIGEASGNPGRGIEIAADFEGKTKWTLTHEIDPDDAKHRMSVVSAARLTAHFNVSALAEHFATLAGGCFLPIPTGEGGQRWRELTAESVEEMGLLAAEMVRDLADGEINAAEARRIIPLIEILMRDMAEMLAMARALSEGGRADG